MAEGERKADYPSEFAFEAAAARIACDVPAIKAVAQVEAGPYGAFDDEGQPTILFERHIFDRLTRGVFRYGRVPGLLPRYNRISSPTPSYRDRSYGPSSIQHTKLQYAVEFDRNAALQSCSWGLFQIMGFNYRPAGYSSLQAFINAMFRSVDDHLDAFVSYILADYRLSNAIRSHDWPRFKLVYNGPAENGYEKKMEAAYASLTGDNLHRG